MVRKGGGREGGEGGGKERGGGGEERGVGAYRPSYGHVLYEEKNEKGQLPFCSAPEHCCF